MPRASSDPLDCLITASESSSESSKDPGAVAGPVSVTSCPSIPLRARCTPMDAMALAAYSNEEPAPAPLCARVRVSSNSTARLRQRCSSRRTMSSPCRAVDRQCTRRSSSPSRYGRGMTSSSPAVSAVLVWPPPSPRQFPASDRLGNGMIAGVTTRVFRAANERVSSTRPNASATRTCSGPIVYLPRAPDWMGYVSSRQPPCSIRSSTKRGRVPSE